MHIFLEFPPNSPTDKREDFYNIAQLLLFARQSAFAGIVPWDSVQQIS